VALAAALALLGWVGRHKDRPLLESSVTITAGARKLTPDLLVQAFCAAKLCTESTPITFARPIARDGKGWSAVVDLPYGTKASTAVARTEEVAAGLDIDEVQVFVSRIRGSEGSARRVTIWVADSDPYAQKPPVTPLASVEAIDFWKAWPFGIDARLRPVELSLVWSSILIGAIPRMGKTFAARLPAAAAALDPFVQLLVFLGYAGDRRQASC
jgi:S-DNA-T family DNA segregation ATPase FtsK/SpoIIIE